MRKTTVSLEDNIHTEIRIYCAKNDCQINELFRDAIQEKLERDAQ